MFLAIEHILIKKLHTTMAVTHADIAPGRKSSEQGSKSVIFIIILSIFLGLCCFILCLVAEATRSEVTWTGSSGKGGENINKCVYNGSGNTPLLCAGGAFLGLATLIVSAHAYLLVVVSKSPQPELMYYDPDFGPAKILIRQAGFFFVSTWVFFAVGETLLLIGLCVESGHLKNWSTPRPTCLILRQGIFSAAGVFSFLTVLLVSGLHIIVLRAHKVINENETVRREVVVIEDRNFRSSMEYLSYSSKKCDLV